MPTKLPRNTRYSTREGPNTDRSTSTTCHSVRFRSISPSWRRSRLFPGLTATARLGELGGTISPGWNAKRKVVKPRGSNGAGGLMCNVQPNPVAFSTRKTAAVSSSGTGSPLENPTSSMPLNVERVQSEAISFPRITRS